MAQPEKLNLWDRLFNRYRREIVEEGNESWVHILSTGEKMPYDRQYVKYKIIHRVTGSERITLEYLD